MRIAIPLLYSCSSQPQALQRALSLPSSGGRVCLKLYVPEFTSGSFLSLFEISSRLPPTIQSACHRVKRCEHVWTRTSVNLAIFFGGSHLQVFVVTTEQIIDAAQKFDVTSCKLVEFLETPRLDLVNVEFTRPRNAARLTEIQSAWQERRCLNNTYHL
jgi:hypothetical protein